MILDKKIESRERYMKLLPRLCKQVEKLERNDHGQQYAQICAKHLQDSTTKAQSKAFQRSVDARCNGFIRKFYFKQKVTEEFVHLADRTLRRCIFRRSWQASAAPEKAIAARRRSCAKLEN